MTVREWCFPEAARRVPGVRPVSVALRALHLAGAAMLLGGHAFGVAAESLTPWLLVALASGAGLILCDVLAWGLYWFVLGKGVGVLAKLALLLVVLLAWEARVPILAVVLLGAGVTSHMPGRLRNYSFLHGRMLGPAPRCSAAALAGGAPEREGAGRKPCGGPAAAA